MNEVAPLKTYLINMSLTVRVLGVIGCTSALQAEGSRFDPDKIHLGGSVEGRNSGDARNRTHHPTHSINVECQSTIRSTF